MTDRVEVGPATDMGDGERRIVSTDRGLEIGVFNVGGEYYALANRCPHRGGPVCTGQVQTRIVAEWPGPGKRTRETVSGIPTVACPWHGWEYELETGTHIGEDSIRLPTFDVVVEDGVVYVEV